MDAAPVPAGGRQGAAPQVKIPPLGGAVARVFPNVSLAMCPLQLSLAPYLLDSGAGIEWTVEPMWKPRAHYVTGALYCVCQPLAYL